MYSVYLLDDEALVLEDMKKSIPWQEHDLMVSGSNTCPLSALDEICTTRPEVVFTDIKMPNMDGLSLIDELRRREIDSTFIVISAYENFDYARELIHLEAFDYLIKPVEERQYTDLLTRLMRRLEKRHPGGSLPATSSDELNHIILYLNKNLHKKHSLKDIAGRFNFSSNYICSLFSKHLGITYSSYITKVRMENAEKLLRGTNKPVKEISAMSGYDDYFYFCRVFRDYFSCTPTQLRGRDEKKVISYR